MNATGLTEGEVLLLIVKRSGMSNAEIAKMLEIHPNHLSKLFKSEKVSQKIKRKVQEGLGIPPESFSQDDLTRIPEATISANEPEIEYKSHGVEGMSAAEVLRYLEEKDRRHHEERMRLLVVIENLTKK